MLIPLSKEETKELEFNSDLIDNFMYDDQLFKKYFKLLRWYDTHSLTTRDPQYKRNQKIAELFNCKPLYYVTYEFKNAVWGFSFKGRKFLVYLSIKGFCMQIEPGFDFDYMNSLVDHLISILCKE